MKKTKITFEDIKAGDLLEVVIKIDGVKSVITGIAFEQTGLQIGEHDVQVWWDTSEGGMIVNKHEESDIYRVDVSEVTFDDIRLGDRIRTTKRGADGRVETVEDTVHSLVGGMNPFWLNVEGDIVLFKNLWLPEGASRVIEILKREGE